MLSLLQPLQEEITNITQGRMREPKEPVPCQGTYTLGWFLAHASILCTAIGADQNKESFPYPKEGRRRGPFKLPYAKSVLCWGMM